jgi:hypothetical protein
MDLLFTRALIAAASLDATKDAQCVAELGMGYRAASQLDVMALYRSYFVDGSLQFTTVAIPQPIYISTTSSPFLAFGYAAPNSAHVACARLSASLLFTRAPIAAASSDATKDAQCVAELGMGYRVASRLDVMALYRSLFVNFQLQFTTAAIPQPIYISTTSSPFLAFGYAAPNSAHVACARF